VAGCGDSGFRLPGFQDRAMSGRGPLPSGPGVLPRPALRGPGPARGLGGPGALRRPAPDARPAPGVKEEEGGR
uniref:Uncharacterized protein n=1 Tax=Monodon monoceros TaxID=40151 RepID=A0A8C6BZW7_MONMO